MYPTPLYAKLTIASLNKYKGTSGREPVLEIRLHETAQDLGWPQEAGQFITLVFQQQSGLLKVPMAGAELAPEQEVRRSYSLNNLPEEPLRILLKRIPNGMVSDWLHHHAVPGMALLAQAPSGQFTLNGVEGQQAIVFAGAGTGLVPLLPLLQAALSKRLGANVYWLVTDPAPSLSLFFDEVVALAAEWPQLHLHYYWTSLESEVLPEHLQRGILQLGKRYQQRQQHMGNLAFETWVKATIGPATTTAHYYLCGPMALMRAQRFQLKLLQVPGQNIHTEDFVISPAAVPTRHYPGQTLQLVVADAVQPLNTLNNETVLNAALRQKIALPYSCRGGRCSACVAKLVADEGTLPQDLVEMTVNEVLSDAQVEAGYFLTCTAHAKAAFTFGYH